MNAKPDRRCAGQGFVVHIPGRTPPDSDQFKTKGIPMKSSQVSMRVFRILCSAILLWAGTARGVDVTRIPAFLYDLFPQNTQGSNGIRLQYRQGGTSTYTDMNYAADYTWNYPNAHYNLPFLIRSATAGRILAEPYYVSTILDPVLRVQVNSKFSRIRVQGTAGKTQGIVVWYIYKGATNWAAPLWQSGSPASFDFEVDCAPGEELFFAINAGTSDASDHSYWQDIRLTAVAFPITPAPASVYDYFPMNTQGSNGIQLLSRVPGASSYATMSYIGDYSWGSPNYHYNFPTVIREGTAGQILAQPLGDVFASVWLDSVMRVQVDAACARVRVQGSTYNFFDVTFSIYKGATNWATPLWSAGAGNSSFDFTVDCTAGDELFFAVSTGNDMGIAPRWYNLTLTGVPTTASIWTAVEVGWPSVSNRWYQVQYRPTVGPTNWLPFGENVLGNGGLMSVFDSCRSNGQRFYQIIEIP
jgi:hypothetical protein